VAFPDPSGGTSFFGAMKAWPGTRVILVLTVALVVIVALGIWLGQPSPDAAFIVSARTGVLTVEPLCGERLVWDLPPGRVARRSDLPGAAVPSEGLVSLALLPGSRATLESTPTIPLRIQVARVDRACANPTLFFEATVNGIGIDDPGGVRYGVTTAPPAPLSLALSGRVVLGAAVQIGGGWGADARGILESGTVDLRVVPWFSRDRVTLRTEHLELGSLVDTHGCLDRAGPREGCPEDEAAPAQGFLRTSPEGWIDAQLYSNRAVGLQSFGGDQHLVEIPESTAAWHSPTLIGIVALLITFTTFYKGIRDMVRDMIGWWRGKSGSAVVLVLLAASAASAEPVEVRQGSLVGAGYTFRRGTSCLVVTARHVVAEMGGAVTVLDRSGAQAQGTRAYDNASYDLALIALPARSLVACTATWPDAGWLARTSFNSRSEFEAVRHYPNGRETIVRLRYAGGIKHLLTLSPADRMTIRESDSGSIVSVGDRLVGIVQSVEAATDRVNVLRFDTIDQLVGDRFRGASAGPVRLTGVASRGRVDPNWGTYIQAWLTEKAGRQVVMAAPANPAAARPRPGAAPTPAPAAPDMCTIAVDVLAWERVSVVNPDYAAVDLQLKACGKRGFLFEQTCAAGRRAASSTPRQVQSHKLTVNAVVTPPGAPAESKLQTSTHMPPSRTALGRTELEMHVLQAAVGPVITELVDRAGCR
jgi:hypothetical protein